tara:strand:+ start:1089 stop:1361 length:273 start_codon:yes stop_codon:yes gene_type:complete
MTSSNLSKIAPKFRTTGNITGNFGKTKVKAGSNLTSIGFSTKDNINVVREKDYIARLYAALDITDDPKLKKFLYTEIKKYLVKTNQWGDT